MPIMLEKLYDALRAADVPDDKARAAAVEVAEFKDAIADIKSTLRLHTWMLSSTPRWSPPSSASCSCIDARGRSSRRIPR